jgi:hypothetical protein
MTGIQRYPALKKRNLGIRRLIYDDCVHKTLKIIACCGILDLWRKIQPSIAREKRARQEDWCIVSTLLSRLNFL